MFLFLLFSACYLENEEKKIINKKKNIKISKSLSYTNTTYIIT